MSWRFAWETLYQCRLCKEKFVHASGGTDSTDHWDLRPHDEWIRHECGDLLSMADFGPGTQKPAPKRSGSGVAEFLGIVYTEKP